LSLSLPKLIMPRHTRETRRPVAPRFTYSIRYLQIVVAASRLSLEQQVSRAFRARRP
jgi:hypothetical protein